MDNVFIVAYEEWEYQECKRFEVLEVFKNRVSAELYCLNFPHDDNYLIHNFRVLKKML